MPRTVPASISTAIATGSTALVRAVEITRRDGTVIRFSETDIPVTVDGELYEPGEGLLVGSIPFGVDGYESGLNVTFAADPNDGLDPTLIAFDDVRNGVYDASTVRVHVINALSSTGDIIDIFRGELTDVQIEREGICQLTFKGLLNRAARFLLEYYSPMCRAFLGDERCKKDLTVGAGLAFNVTVATVVGPYEFTVTGVSEPDDWFKDGFVKFTSGALLGEVMEVRGWANATGTVLLFIPTERTLAPGDTLEIYTGCDKTVATCNDKFDNVLNMRAEPNIPAGLQVTQSEVGGVTAPGVGTVIAGLTTIIDFAHYIFADVPLGTASPERVIVAVVHSVNSGSAGRTLTSLTLDGVAMTIDKQVTSFGSHVAICSLLVPTGSSGSFTMVWSAAVGEASMEVYSLLGLSSATNVDAQGTATTAGANASSTVNVNAGGVVIAGFTGQGSLTGLTMDLCPVTWTGVGEDADFTGGGEGTSFHSATSRISCASKTGIATAGTLLVAEACATQFDALAVVSFS